MNAALQCVDYLIHDAIVLTLADSKGCGLIPNGALAIRSDKIIAVGESNILKKKFTAHRYIDCTNKVVMPGIIDAHMHTEVSIYRGLAQDSKNWMSDCVFPLRTCLDDASAKVGSLMMIGEAIKAGTTTFVDQNERMRLIAENHHQAGVRAVISQTVNALPKRIALLPSDELYPLESDIEEHFYLESEKLIHTWHEKDHGRITCGINPHGPDRLSINMLRRLNHISEKLNLPIFMHLACGERETKQMKMRYQKRSIPFLKELNMLHSRLIGIHLSVATAEELRTFAASGAGMILCSGSEAIVDGNIPPAVEFNRMSPRLAIGSDQTSGGNNSNMFYEMKVGALLNKCKFRDPEIFQAWKMLRLATIDGARTLGMDHLIGSLEPGKKADLIVIDMNLLHMAPVIYTPLRNIIPNLVYATNGSEVCLSMVNGNIIMEDRKLINLDEDEIIYNATEESKRLMCRASKNFLGKETTTTRLMRDNKL